MQRPRRSTMSAAAGFAPQRPGTKWPPAPKKTAERRSTNEEAKHLAEMDASEDD